MKTQDMRYVSLKAQAEAKACVASHAYNDCLDAPLKVCTPYYGLTCIPEA